MNQKNISSTKDKILDVAIDLFSKKGYLGVSIREITREVGIKESSLYNHFKNKDEILETIFIIFRKEFSKTMPPLSKVNEKLTLSNLQQFLERGYERFKEHLNNPYNEKLWRILFFEHYRDPLARDIFLNDIIQETLTFLEYVFEKLIKHGKIKPLSPSLLATQYQYPMFAMLLEYNMLRYDNQKTCAIESKMKEHIRYFLDTIKVEEK